MLRLSILQDQWLILALLGGLAFVLVVVLSYVAIWRPRGGAATRQLRSAVPWVLVATIVFAVLYVVIYTIRTALYPPNW